MKKFIAVVAVALSFNAMAWDGYDYEAGAYVEIEKGNRVSEGEDVEFYDYGAGEYRYGEVQDIDSDGDIEILDSETGEVREFDMD